ncbi:MAG: T9SS type A sorting domain-containing protein [Calditrichaeota bacterium]|nr:T9SS type A sorting domain-containing protein [Calditrichota bacterium]
MSSPANESNGTRYVFTQWSGDYSGTNSSGSTTMSGPKEVVANWKTQYFLSMTENPPEGGTATPAPPGVWYDENESVQISATAATSYHWDGWSGDVTGMDNPTQVTMNGPKNITANFLGEEIITKPNKPTGPQSGIIGQQLTYSTGGSTSNLGHSVEYKFDWGDGSESNWGSKTKSHTYNETGTYTVKAKARCTTHINIVSSWSSGLQVDVAGYHLNVSVSPENAGEVQRSPNKNEYAYHESVRLTAVASNQAYVFDHWSGDLTGSTNPKTITMNGNKNVTANFVMETVSIPNKPTGPSSLKAGDEYHFSTGGASSSLGHSIQYQFDFGDGNQSNWGSASVDYVYSKTGDFEIKAHARCAEHSEVVSDWSAGLIVHVSGLMLTVNVNPDLSGHVTINPDKQEYDLSEVVQIRAFPADVSWEFQNWTGDIDTTTWNPVNLFMKRDRVIYANFISETVSKPAIIEGPTSGTINVQMTFVANNASSSFGHVVEYQFDWGDSTKSEWGDASQQHFYSNTGIMYVRAHARCAQHPRVVSEWSASHEINISAYTLTILIDPPGWGEVNKNPDDSTFAAGETVELFAAGNKGYSFTEWSGDLIGNENPKNIVMNSDKTVTAHFTRTEETVSAPTFVAGPDSGIMGRFLTFSTGGSVSNLGNPVEYQFKWGDGLLSTWDDSVKSHAYFVTGIKLVQSRARSKVNMSIVSGWSQPQNVTLSGRKLVVRAAPEGAGQILVSPHQDEYPDSATVHLTAVPNQGYTFNHWNGSFSGNDNPITIVLDCDKDFVAEFSQSEEQISPPISPVAVEQGIIGQHIVFSTDSARSNLGNEVEYQFNWGDGTLSQWGAKERAHVYFMPYTFEVRARGRSKVSSDVISNWSAPHLIEISGLELNIIVEPESSGVVVKSPQKVQYAYQDTVRLYTVGLENYSFDHWSGDLTGDFDPGVIVMNGNKEVTAFFGVKVPPVTAPQSITGPDKGYRAQSLVFVARGAKTANGDSANYQFDWGDGLLSTWGDSVQSHKFFNSGDYLVRSRARSKSDTVSVSNWSGEFQVRISGCKLIVNLDPENAGDVEKFPNESDYDFNEIVELKANDSPNYIFVNWNGVSRDTSRSKLITMVGDTTITAFFESVTGVESEGNQKPTSYALSQNYPNPFNPETRIKFQIPKPEKVKLTVYNIRGQIVRVLLNEFKPAGFYTLIWDARNENGEKVPTGVYLYRFETSGFNQVKKMVLIR